jgi:hypothetical protein
MVPFVGPDPELSGQKADADDDIPIPVPLKNRINVDAVEKGRIESVFQPFFILLRPSGSANTVPIRSGIPLGSLFLAWNEKEDPRTSVSEKVLIKIGFVERR